MGKLILIGLVIWALYSIYAAFKRAFLWLTNSGAKDGQVLQNNKSDRCGRSGTDQS